MKILKAFNKALGKFLFAALIIFFVCFYIGMLGISIYLTLMSWVEMPFEAEQTALYLPLDTKIFGTFCGVLMIFVILGFTYMFIDFEILNPAGNSAIPPLPPSRRPKVPKTENKSKPILG